jgi:hypothetical protein
MLRSALIAGERDANSSYIEGYAASLGMAFSTNRSNRVLRAKEIDRRSEASSGIGCVYRNLSSGVVVVKSAKDGV